jgi:hypothetical protein
MCQANHHSVPMRMQLPQQMNPYSSDCVPLSSSPLGHVCVPKKKMFKVVLFCSIRKLSFWTFFFLIDVFNKLFNSFYKLLIHKDEAQNGDQLIPV